MAEAKGGSGDKARNSNWGWMKDGALLAGVAAIATVGLQFPTFLKQGDIREKQDKIAEQQTKIAEQQNELTRQVTVSNRYDQASTQLASENSIERIAGIYALRDFATDHKDKGPRVLRLLASYLVITQSDEKANRKEPMSTNERAVVAGILSGVSYTVKQSYENGNELDNAVSPLAYDLSGVSLPGNDLSHLQSEGGFFMGLDVSNADLSDASIICANLMGAKLTGANLRGATLDKILVDENTDFSGLLEAGPETFGDLYWEEGEGPTFPQGLMKDKAGSRQEHTQKCT